MPRVGLSDLTSCGSMSRVGTPEESGRDGLSEQALVGDVLLRRYEAFLAASENWRRRASTAAGLLSAGAAALLAGLILGPRHDVPGFVRWLVSGAAACYLTAVIMFLEASTRSPVRVKYDPETGLMKKAKGRQPSRDEIPREKVTAGLAWEEAKIQVAPLKKLVFLGKLAAGSAVLLTITSVLSLFWLPEPQATVSVYSSETLRHIHSLCPDYKNTSLVSVNSLAERTITFTIPSELCKVGETRVAVSSLAAAVSFKESR